MILASLSSFLWEPHQEKHVWAWEPPGEERMARQLKEFGNEPRWEVACISHHVAAAFEGTRDVLFGCGLRKGRRQ